MASKENLRPLKTLVISMGFLLIGGTVFLAAVVWKKVTSDISHAAKVPACPGGTLDLKGQGVVTDSRIEGRTMHLLTESKSRILSATLVDMCSGSIISKVTIETDGIRREDD